MSQTNYQVVYLTGSPATGKSTLVKTLAERVPGLLNYSYSKALAEYVSRRSAAAITREDLRRESAGTVTSEDVAAVDDLLIQFVAEKRAMHHIVIDSHPVTQERFGFRVAPFKTEKLLALAPTMIVCLYARASVVVDRISVEAGGRPAPSSYEVELHNSLQGTVAIQYGILLGKNVYFLDSEKPVESLADEIIKRL